MHEALDVVAFIGLDWADKKHVYWLQEQGKHQRERGELEQKAEALHAWVAELRARFSGGRIAIALEQSKGALVYALMSYDFILLFPINPKSLARFREAFRVSGAKDDPGDSKLLLDMVVLHHSKLTCWKPDDVQTRKLQMLVEQRRNLVEDRVALTNRLTTLLKQSFPQVLDWFEAGNAALWDFLTRWPTLQQAQKMKLAQLREFYRHHRTRKPAIDQRWQQIRSCQPLTEAEAVLVTSSLVLRALVGQLGVLRQAVKLMDEAIAEVFEHHPDAALFDSLPGAGAVCAPRLSAAFGSQRNRFPSPRSMQQLSGIAPVTKRSGSSISIERRFACPKFLLQTFHEYAAHSIPHSSWAKAYYDEQRARGKRHHCAVRALAFKWIRIIHSCWTKKQLYSEERYVDALRRRGSPLVKRLKAA